MTKIHVRLDAFEEHAAAWMAEHGLSLLRRSLGVVFVWFGVLKFFPGMSPAEDLAARTIALLTFGIVGPNISLPVLAAWECAIGLSFVTGWLMRAGVVLLFAQMAGTFLPLAFFPGEVWTHAPYAATLEGQYIIKNLVLVSAGLVIGATVRGYTLVRTHRSARSARSALPVLASTTVVLCAAPEARCRTVPVDTAALPATVRAAFLHIQKSM